MHPTQSTMHAETVIRVFEVERSTRTFFTRSGGLIDISCAALRHPIVRLFRSTIMTRSRLIPIARSLAVAGALCALSAPVFASGYGPSPYYQPGVGAPVSQRGISAQTLAAEQKT